MAIHGPLKELGLHDVFQLLDLGRKTGVLRVVSLLRQNEGTIWFHEAGVVAAAIKSNPHPLGMSLLRVGKIRQEDLTRARGLQEDGDTRRLGEILVSFGAVSQRDLERQVRAQVEDVIFTVLGWQEGHFTFDEGTLEGIPREADIRISTESLMLEAARRIDEWSRIQSKVPHLGVVPRIAPMGTEEPGSLQLVPFEWRLLAACDGHIDARTIARHLGESDFDVARALFGLATASVILLQDPTVDAVAASPRQDPATMLRQGEEHLRLGDAESARLLAETAMAAFPDHPGGHLLLGRGFLRETAFDEAARALREAVRLDPGSCIARRLLGSALVGTAQFQEAATVWEAWLRMDRPPTETRHEEAIRKQVEAARSLDAGLRGPSE